MDNSIKKYNQISNLVDITQDVTNPSTDECLISSGRNNITNSNSKKQKKVKFSQKVIYIDVECWKKYNSENTLDENLDNLKEEEEEEEEDNNKLKNNNNKKKVTGSKKDNIVCTCILI